MPESAVARYVSLEAGVVGVASALGYLVHYSHRRPAPGTDGGFPTLVLVSSRRQRVVAALLLADDAEPSIGEATWLAVLADVGRLETVTWRPESLRLGEVEAYLR